MTFEEIRAVIRQELEVEDGTKLYSSFERSLRHALHRMVSNGGLIAIGGRADPFRYSIDPMIIAMTCDTKEEWHAWLDALSADPGASEALNKWDQTARDGLRRLLLHWFWNDGVRHRDSVYRLDDRIRESGRPLAQKTCAIST
jgi:hypothetical protein